jgi:hypothetical protein
MSTRNVPWASIGTALVLGLAGSASAAASAEDETRRLDDHYFFVQKLGRGWEPLLADMDRSLDSLKDAPAEKLRPMRGIVDAARENVAKARAADGTEAGESRALELYDVLAKTAVDETKRPGFHAACAKILMDRADRAEKVGDEAHDAQALELAKAAVAHVAGFPRAVDTIGRLGFKVGLAQEAREEYEAAMSQFEATIEALKAANAADDAPKVVEGRGYVERIKKNTGPLAVAWLGDPRVLANVQGGKTEYSQATLTFSGAGKAPPQQSADKPRRMRVGEWKVTATGVGGAAPFVATVVVTPSGGEFTMPVAVPDGMILVPASGDEDAFFIDRTETSNARLSEMTGRGRGGDPRAAASGLSYADAKAAAERAGKRLPTLAQWTYAAFGAPNAPRPRYPWGDAEGEPGTQFVAGDEAQSVESCPSGASALGCLNMAGNVWEWIEHRGGGWLIGGGWQQRKFDRSCEVPEGLPWKADFLRDPLPTEDTYGAGMSKADEAKYFKYQATAATTLPQAGMRCVVALGKPRR